jgi:hypothetical protein
VHDHRAVESVQHPRSLFVGRARVDDHRLAELHGQLELDVEHPPLVVARGIVAVEVEPDLANRDRAVELVCSAASEISRTLGYDASRAA